MKRTTIMVEEELLYDLQRIARSQNKTASAVVREALSAYVVEQHEKAPPENPWLSLIGIFESVEPTDVSNGGDEKILREGIHPIYGWGIPPDERDDHGYRVPVRADEQERRRAHKVHANHAKPARKRAAARHRPARNSVSD